MGLNELSGVNNKIKPGCCAHGLPAGACPVCSMSGGGIKRSDRSRNVPGEMTYHECVIMGNLLKERALAQKKHEANLKHHLQAMEQFETTMARLAEKMSQFMKMLSQIPITKPIAFVVQHSIIPIINFVQNIPNFLNTIKEFFPNITDKLCAVFGEAKAFLNKQLEKMTNMTKLVGNWIFKIFKKNNTEDDDTKIDDDKKIFNLKTMIQKIKEKFKQKKEK